MQANGTNATPQDLLDLGQLFKELNRELTRLSLAVAPGARIPMYTAGHVAQRLGALLAEVKALTDTLGRKEPQTPRATETYSRHPGVKGRPSHAEHREAIRMATERRLSYDAALAAVRRGEG
jgi:hypothetical protein